MSSVTRNEPCSRTEIRGFICMVSRFDGMSAAEKLVLSSSCYQKALTIILLFFVVRPYTRIVMCKLNIGTFQSQLTKFYPFSYLYWYTELSNNSFISVLYHLKQLTTTAEFNEREILEKFN